MEHVDPLHDPFDLEVEPRELATPDLELGVDPVGLGRRAWGHCLILHIEILDVKVLTVYLPVK